MYGRITLAVMAVAAITAGSAMAQSTGSLTLVNQTGWPLNYTVEDNRGQRIAGGEGCLDLLHSVVLSGTAYANRSLVVVHGQTRNGGRGSRCHGSTAAHTGNVRPTRLIGANPTRTFTLNAGELLVR